MTTRDALVDDLRATRKRGYAIDNEENVVGIRCFAVPMTLGPAAADAISCSVPIERLGGRETEIVAAIRRTAISIERMVPN